jgi:hypothetical protein
LQTRQVVALVIVVTTIALALGATIGYSVSSGRTSTTTQTGKTSTMTISYGTLFSQSTTYTTVSRTTVSFGGITYATTTGEYSGCIPPVQCYLTTITTGINSSSQTTTSTSLSCTISAEGSGTYVTVESDTGQPIQGVQVSGIIATDLNGETCRQNIGIFLTNSTGTALITQTMGSYYLLSILYQDRNYTATAPILPMQSTYVTLKVPSGNVSISEISYGGCQRNSSGTVCP